MRVAICSAGELYGGVEQFVYLLAQHLRTSDNTDVMVILFEDGRLYEKLQNAGVETYLVRSAFKYDPRMVKSVSNILSRRQIDVVHTHGYRANIICALAARRLGSTVVKTEHGRLETALEPRLCSLRMYAYTIVDQLVTLGFVDHIVYVTFDLASRLRCVHRRKKTTVIHNAIAPIGPDGPNPFGQHSFNIGIVGRVSKIKGHMVLLKAIERLSDLSDLRLYVIGSGPLEPMLKTYCLAHGLDSKVSFLGFREDIQRCMSELDVLVMPSLHEGVPYAALEAMYLHVPIIASEVGGLQEILSNDENAVLVPPKDSSTLATAIRGLHGDPWERKRIAQRAFADVMSRFLIDKMAQKYINVYRTAIARVRKGKQRTAHLTSTNPHSSASCSRVRTEVENQRLHGRIGKASLE